MYISVRNKQHPKVKYLIIDSTAELNVPILPRNFTLAFKEKYTNNLKILTESELVEFFKENKIFYDVIFLNSSFKLTENDGKKLIKDTLDNKFSNLLKFNSNFKFNFVNNDLVDFTQCNTIYKKEDFDRIISNLQEKIDEIYNDLNLISSNLHLDL